MQGAGEDERQLWGRRLAHEGYQLLAVLSPSWHFCARAENIGRLG